MTSAGPSLVSATQAYSAASSPPHRSQYHSVGAFIVPHSLHRSVFAASA